MDTNHNTDHDMLVRIDTKLDGYIATSNTTLQDHETRLRAVETTNQRLKGAQWILGAAVTLGMLILGVLQYLRG